MHYDRQSGMGMITKSNMSLVLSTASYKRKYFFNNPKNIKVVVVVMIMPVVSLCSLLFSLVLGFAWSLARVSLLYPYLVNILKEYRLKCFSPHNNELLYFIKKKKLKSIV
ncbi:unnamed protein product [Orchesella dallaii]|uniref:Uncharacterized protein n=1 Tax=Orchesella dallaii TaxID=48710 RepID=A0ABP1RU28_9HEXA